MTKVKICGITNLEDAELSVKFGADALGFNFYPKSPRYIAPEKAAEIIEKLPKDVLKVGVFVNETLENIVKTAAVAGLDAIQLHGEETPEFLNEVKAASGLEIIKAFRVAPDFKPEDVLKYNADAILLDAYSPKEHGGTGETFDWEIARKVQEIFPKMYLAGGISNSNVIDATRRIQPFAIDVCSGIEASKGTKDRVKLICFMARSQWAERSDSDVWEFDNLLFHLFIRPDSYLGGRSLARLQSFLDGFVVAIGMVRPDFDFKGFLGEFDSWLARKTSKSTADNLCSYIARNYGDNDESYDYFFSLWEEFRLEHR